MRAVLAFVLVALCASALAVVIDNPTSFCTVSLTTPVNCQVALQTQQQDGEYCGWCNTADEAAHWYYCSKGSVCAQRGSDTFRRCYAAPNDPEIGDTCSTDGTVDVCQQKLYNTLCLDQTPQLCGGQNIYAPGEDCPDPQSDINLDDKACRFGTCTGGKCPSGNGGCVQAGGSAPDTFSTAWCVPTTYCNVTTDNVNGTCVSRLETNGNTPCQYGDDPTGCAVDGMCNSKPDTPVCVKYTSLALNAACSNSLQCQEGLYCNSNGACVEDNLNDVCNYNSQNCGDDSDCVCNWNKGEAFCEGASISTNEYATYTACLRTNGCDPMVTMFPDNCRDKCYNQYANSEAAKSKGRPTEGLKGTDNSAAAALVPLFAALVAAIALLL